MSTPDNARPRIMVAEPKLGGNEAAYVQDCMESTWISSAGSYIEKFERSLTEVTGTKHVVSANNGTTALHLALSALGIGPGDEVVVPSLTYIASANAVGYCGATPVFADVERGSMGLDAEDAARRITSRTKAIMAVHLYGHPADMTAITALAGQHGIPVVEDAAEAHTATWDGRPVGSHGLVGTFSFFGNKVLTTGEGGAVSTDDDELAARLRLLRGQGMDPARRYWFPVKGFNYRMTNIEAAIGCAQLEQLPDFLRRRREIADHYGARLAGVDGLETPTTSPRATRVNWLYTVLLPDRFSAEQRDQLMAQLSEDGVETRPVFYPMHQLPPYAQEDTFPVSTELARRGVSLPTHVNLSDDDLDRVADRFLARLAALA